MWSRPVFKWPQEKDKLPTLVWLTAFGRFWRKKVAAPCGRWWIQSIDRLIDCSIYWLIYWLLGRLIDWLIDWFLICSRAGRFFLHVFSHFFRALRHESWGLLLSLVSRWCRTKCSNVFSRSTLAVLARREKINWCPWSRSTSTGEMT